MPEHRALNLEEIGKLTATAKQLAKRYRALTGKPIGIAGEVAEYEADGPIDVADKAGRLAPEEKAAVMMDLRPGGKPPEFQLPAHHAPRLQPSSGTE